MNNLETNKSNDSLLLNYLIIGILTLSMFSCHAQDNLFKNAGFITKQTTNSKVTVYRISDGRIMHRFFGTSPISPSGRYIALFRVPFEDHIPEAGDVGEVVLVDLMTGKEKTIAQTRGWELQVAANVQWGKTDEELYFNDIDTSNWTAHAIKLNPFTNESKRMGGTVFEVSQDGTKLASHNLIASRSIMAGYGVVVPDEYWQKNFGPVETDGIYVTSTATGKCKMVASIHDIYENTQPPIKFSNPKDYEFYCFQVKWNPQGTRLLIPFMWKPKGGEAQSDPQNPGQLQKAIITMREDGTEICTAVTPEEYDGHHMMWMPDGERLSMNLRTEGDPRLHIKTFKYDGSDKKIVYSPGSGHPSFHPGGIPLIITDAYPGEEVATGDAVPIRYINTQSGNEMVIDSVFVSMFKNNLRIDAHPAWDRSGRFVVYNGTVNGSRAVFVADLRDLIKSQFPDFTFKQGY